MTRYEIKVGRDGRRVVLRRYGRHGAPRLVGVASTLEEAHGLIRSHEKARAMLAAHRYPREST